MRYPAFWCLKKGLFVVSKEKGTRRSIAAPWIVISLQRVQLLTGKYKDILLSRGIMCNES